MTCMGFQLVSDPPPPTPRVCVGVPIKGVVYLNKGARIKFECSYTFTNQRDEMTKKYLLNN